MVNETDKQKPKKQAQAENISLLTQAISVTKQTQPDRVKELLHTFTEEALKGSMTWNKNLTQTILSTIKAIDQQISKQLATIMHTEKFRTLEGSWRGLRYLVQNSFISSQLKIKVLNAKKLELAKNMSKALEFDQTELFKKIYEEEFGTAGGEPYATLICDYELTNHPQDIEFMKNISQVAAAAFCPVIAAAGPGLLGLDSWTELSKPRDLEKIFDSPEYVQWRELRDSEDSRFINLVMPRALARLPYGSKTLAVEEFSYEETTFDSHGNSKALPHEHYCWMNAAYVLGAKLTESFAENGWCTAIRGAEGGGKVEGLPTHIFTSDDGDTDLKCPTEIGITDRREAELSKLGFLPLCHYKNTNYSVFFGAQSIQKPAIYDTPEATSNAAISARLPYIMATSRFAHYIKILARDKIGSFMEANDVSSWLNRWILYYVNGNPDCGARMKAKYPLAEAKIDVQPVPGQSGSYHAVAWMRPWLQLEELSTSIRMVARIPSLA